jgi:hypothetical protein
MPSCGSVSVAEQAKVSVEYTGTFFENGEGKPEFDYDIIGADIFWDCEEPEEPKYRCRECFYRFDAPIRLDDPPI